MAELKKTLLFLAGAVVILLVAWWSHYTPAVSVSGDMRGNLLCPNLTDALAATGLEIFEYDPNTVRIKTFKVAQINNRWCIPSHENYPADAKQHLAQAATALIGVKILDVASESPTQEELVMYGVVEPDNEVIKTVTRGVGKRVVFRDRDDKVLADVIIGNKVPDREELRYVRIKGQEPVYIVKLSDDKFSSEFGDWIEKDLLQLNPWDIRDVQLHDYSFDPLTGGLTPRSQVVLSYDDLGNPRWKLVRSLVFDMDQGQWTPRSLGEDEELDTAKLDGMRTALDDLKIVDVRRKPQGISASLSADGSVKANQETAASLSRAGFYLASAQQFYQIFPMIGQRQIKPTDVEVISSEGEIRVGMKDGVRYLLRFGRVVEGQGGAAEQSGSGVNRYLFVVAEFDPELIPKPELQPLPELPAEGQKPTEQTPGAQSTTTEQKTAITEAATQADSQSSAPAEKQAPTTPPSQPGGTSEKPATGEASPQGAPAGGQSQSAQTGTPTEQHQTTQEKKPEDIKAERERIEKENKRKQEEYQEKLKKGEERVKELNARFAEWYYIISDEVYRKIHLGMNDIVKKKEKPTEQKNEQGQQAASSSTAPQASQAEQPGEATKPAASSQEAPQSGAGAPQPSPKPGEQESSGGTKHENESSTSPQTAPSGQPSPPASEAEANKS